MHRQALHTSSSNIIVTQPINTNTTLLLLLLSEGILDQADGKVVVIEEVEETENFRFVSSPDYKRKGFLIDIINERL